MTSETATSITLHNEARVAVRRYEHDQKIWYSLSVDKVSTAITETELVAVIHAIKGVLP